MSFAMITLLLESRGEHPEDMSGCRPRFSRHEVIDFQKALAEAGAIASITLASRGMESCANRYT